MSTTRANLEFFDPRPEGVAEAVRRLSEYDRGQEVRRLTAAATIAPDDDLVLVTTGGVGVTVTLPLAKEAQRKLYHIKKIDGAAGAVTVARQGSDTIDGAISKSLATQYETLELLPDASGNAWWSVSSTSGVAAASGDETLAWLGF